MFRGICIFVLAVALPVGAAAQSSQAALTWDPSSDPAVVGYILDYGTASNSYSKSINLGLETKYTVQGLAADKTYYFSVRAYDGNNQFSARSNVVVLAPCSTEFSSSAQSVSAFGADASFTLWTGAGCPWTLGSSADWVTLSSADLAGSSSKMITFNVAPNTTKEARTAIVYSANRSLVVTQPGRIRDDFNGDARVDLLWQNYSTGAVSVWRMKGTSIDRGDSLTPGHVGDTDWKMAGTLDADRDGYTDILFRHDAGHVAIWRMQGEARIENVVLDTNVVADPLWQIVGTGDMDRDEFDDIIWQHADGRVAVWYMTALEVREVVEIATVSDDRWRVAAMADFDDDGKLDILWRHTSWGQFLVWHMDDRQYLSSGMHLIMANSEWQVTAVGDFNGDTRPDLIWRNARSGELAAWLLDGASIASSVSLNPWRIDDINWRIAGPR